jgi:hypothetical protein
MKKVLIATGVAVLAFASIASAQGLVFNTNLTVGSTGPDVANLQTWLINNGFSIPSIASGAAAKGYFGAQTKTAVMAFQASRGIPNTGFVGPLTRAALGGSAPVGTPAPVGCPVGYNCTPVGGGTPAPVVTGGTEGELTNFDTLGDVESSVEESDSDAKVLGISVDAEDSDMTITRVDVDLVNNSGTGSQRLNRYFDSVSLWLDGKKIAEKDADEASEDDDVYSFRFTGLKAVVEEGDTAELYVSVDVVSNVDGDDEGAEWTVSMTDNALRAVDTAGISDTYGDASDETFEVAAGLTGVELKVSRSSADLDDRTVEASEDSDTNGVTLLVFKLKAEDSDITVDEIPVAIATTSGVEAANIGQIAKRFTLYKGSELLDSVTATSAVSGLTAIFEDLNLDIAEGASVELTVKADINDLNNATGDFSNGDGLTASISAGNVDAIDAEDENGDSLATSALTGTASGKNVVFFSEGIDVDLVGISQTITDSSESSLDDIVTFVIKFKVTAFGEDAYIATTSGTTTTSTKGVDWSVIGGTYTGNGSSNLTSTADKTTNDNAFLVEDGTSETFTLTVVLNNAVGPAGFYGVQIDEVKFSDTDSAVIADYEALTTGLDDLETDQVPLN